MMLINPYTNAASFNCQPIQTSQLIFGTGTSNQFEVPFYGLRVYGESANILPQTTIGGKKQIYRVGWFFSGFTVPPTYTFNNVQIWMAHTTNGEFPSNVSVGYSTMSIKDLTKVYEGSWSVSANNQWIYAPMQQNFCYNGVDNLLIIAKNLNGNTDYISFGSTKYSSLTAAPVGSQFRMAYVSQDASYPANGTLMTRQQRVSNIQLWW